LPHCIDLLDLYAERRSNDAPGDAVAELDPALAVPAALRAALSAFDHTNTPGSRSAALLLLGHTCDATVSELVALDIAHLTGTNEGLLSRDSRNSPLADS
jgi:hypothetical protein